MKSCMQTLIDSLSLQCQEKDELHVRLRAAEITFYGLLEAMEERKIFDSYPEFEGYRELRFIMQENGYGVLYKIACAKLKEEDES